MDGGCYDSFWALADRDIERAKELLVEGSRDMHFDVNQLMEAVIPKLLEDERHEFFQPFKDIDINIGGLSSVESFVVWADDLDCRVIKLNNEKIRAWRHGKIFQALVRSRPEVAVSFLKNSKVPSGAKKTLYLFLRLNDSHHLNLFKFVPQGERPYVVSSLAGMDSTFRFGPIDGKEGGGVRNWAAHHEEFAKVIREADLPIEVETRYLEFIESGMERENE